MNPIVKFAYYTIQVLCIFPILYACIRYRDAHDYDAFAFRLNDRLNEWFPK